MTSLPSIQDFINSKIDMDDYSKLVSSEDQDVVITRLGRVATPLARIEAIALQRAKEVGVIYDDPIRPLVPGLLVEDLRAHKRNGQTYIPKASLPFTTGSAFDPSQWTLLQGVSAADLAQSSAAELVATSSGNTVQYELDQLKPLNTTSWYTAGDGVAPDLLFDATNELGLNLTDSDVDSIVNLGKVSDGALLPTSATKSPIEIRSGFNTVTFDGGSTYKEYSNTSSSYAAGLFSTTKVHAINTFYVNNDIVDADSVPFSIGLNGQTGPRLNLRDSSNPLAYTMEYQDGTTLESSGLGGYTRTDNTITGVGTYHDGVSNLSIWINGAVVRFNEDIFDISASSPLSGDTVSIGAISGDTLPLTGNVLATSVDNNDTLTLDQAYAKYKAAFYRFGGVAKPSFELLAVGQSNAEGDFPNSDPYNFGAGEAYYYKQSNSATGEGIFIRDGFGHDSTKIGDSCPAIWFAAELKRLSGLTPIFQDLTFSGEPISPGLSPFTFYQSPKNDVGDAAGQTSRIYQWAKDFQRMKDLCDYSPEFLVKERIAYFMCGEADARSIADYSATLTKDELKGWLNSWLDSLVSNYGIRKFAIINIGRRGINQTEIDSYAAAIALVREGISEVISERSDCYDVFPHLNYVPDPFVLDDLIVDSDGAWVSGQANNADGLHYTDVMYKAIGITAARNFFTMTNLS